MAIINPELFSRIMQKLNLSKRQVYRLIDEKVLSTSLPRHLAVFVLAAENGISISKYATEDNLALIRQTAIRTIPSPTIIKSDINEPVKKGKKRKKAQPIQRRGNSVFVVHGRDIELKNSVFSFLRSIGLKPLEWNQAIMLARKASPYVGEILEAAFREAAAIVVLLTPDDEVKLKKIFIKPSDPDYEKRLTGQARPNVLFEAGMAFGKNPNSTVIVQIGDLRSFSDIGGRHVLHLSNSPASRNEFVAKLANAGCNVDTSGSDWLNIGDFSINAANKTKTSNKKK